MWSGGLSPLLPRIQHPAIPGYTLKEPNRHTLPPASDTWKVRVEGGAPGATHAAAVTVLGRNTGFRKLTVSVRGPGTEGTHVHREHGIQG